MSDKIKTQSAISSLDLEKFVLEKREHLRNTRFNIAGSKVKNVREQRNTKKDIARALTELNARSKQK
jgi:ribosomal protein L29